MASSYAVLGKRNKKGVRDRFEDYSAELGLRTHRPSDDKNHGYGHPFRAAPSASTIATAHSIVTTDSSERGTAFLPTFEFSSKHHSNKLRYQLSLSRDGVASAQHSSLDALSHCSNVAQFGNGGDWWELPSRNSNTSYKQKTKSVRVSYSIDEIYGKANIERSSHASVEKEKMCSGVFENDFRSSTTSNHKSTLLQEKLHAWSSAPEPNSFTMDHTFSNGPRAQRKESFNEERQQTCWEGGCLGASEGQEPLLAPSTEVKYRTFEQAVHFYPEEDTDDSDMSPRSVSLGDTKISNEVEVVGVSCDAVSSDSFAADEESTPLVSLNNAIPSTNRKHSLLSPTSRARLDPDTRFDSLTPQLQETTLEETASLTQSSAHAWVVLPDEGSTLLHVSSPSNDSSPDVAATLSTQVAEDKSTQNISQLFLKPPSTPKKEKTSSQKKQEKEHKADAHLLANGNQGILEKQNSPANVSTALTHEVPPIDLSQLSPRPTKSRKSGSKAFPKSTSSSKNRTSVPTQMGQTKRRATSSLYSKFVDANNQREIAREIKMLVQKNPACIAGEIKRRVEQKSKKSATETSAVTTDSDCSKRAPSADAMITAAPTEREYLRLKTTSQPPSALYSFNSYDRYIAMSPRIESGEISRWQCLPEEVWLVILSFLQLSDLHSFMLTCSDFNRLAHDWSLWDTVSLFKKNIADDEIVRLGRLHPSRLSIVQCTGVKMNGDTVSNKGLREMFSSCGDNLKHLSTASCVMPPLSGEAMLHHAVLHCPAIQSLDVSWCNLTDRDVELIADNFSALTGVCVNGNQAITDVGMVKLLGQLCNQLRCVEMQGCFKLTNRSLEEVGGCTNLHTLNIGQCHRLHSACISREVSRLPNLASFNLKGLKQVKDNCIAGIVKYCTNIKQLIISQCTSLTSRSVVELSCSLHKLEVLGASSCKGCVDDTSLRTLLTNCKKLVCLDLSSTLVSDQSMGAISESCFHIKDLKLNFCPITDVAINDLLAQCKSLKSISLFGVKGIAVEELSATHPLVSIET